MLRSLSQTRESLSAEESFLEQPGQLLDKALAKQIAKREAELDSLTASNKKNVSVIVRCSTPDSEATCSKGNPASHFPDQVPEDFSIPLNYLLVFSRVRSPSLTASSSSFSQQYACSSSLSPRGPSDPS